MTFTAEDGTILKSAQECAKYELLWSSLANKVETLIPQVDGSIDYTSPFQWSDTVDFGWVLHIKEALTPQERELFFKWLEQDSYDEGYDFSVDYTFDEETVLMYTRCECKDGGIFRGYVQLPPFIVEKMFPKQ